MDKDPRQDGEQAKRKGKGKALDEQLEQPSQAASNGQQPGDGRGSGLARLAESATQLPAALFGSALGPGELPRLGAGEKGASSRSREGLMGAGEGSAAASATASAYTANPANATIRSGQTQEHIAEAEAAFATFLDSTAADLSLPEEGERAWQLSDPVPRPQLGPEGPASSVAEQERRDGAKVAILLSTETEPEPDYGLSEPITDAELAGLRRALFPEGPDNHSTAPVAWDNVLNFIPQYFQQPDGPALGVAAMDRAAHLGGIDTEEAWSSWVAQWSRVLTGYQDEVWGDLGALVEEARAEVKRLEQVNPSEKPPQPTALLRLRAILGHLRGTGLP